MSRLAVSWIMIAAFAGAIAAAAWRAWGPPMPEYTVGGEVTTLTAPISDAASRSQPPAKSLYLRHVVYLSQRPRHAWLQVLGRDSIELFINGKLVEKQALDSFPVAIVADITPYFQLGRNAIAIRARQASFENPPAVAVCGAYTLNDGEHFINSDSLWRSSTVFERDAAWWFAREFDDRSWPEAARKKDFLKVKLAIPPAAFQEASIGHWITPFALADHQTVIHRVFTATEKPRSAWLRVTATSSYRLAINGVVLDEQESQLGSNSIVPPVRRTYDFTPLATSGDNACALYLTSTVGSPHVLIDGEIETVSGNRLPLSSDGQWLARSGPSPDWLEIQLPDPGKWQHCSVENGDMGCPPWVVRHETIQLSWPLSVTFRNAVSKTLLIALIALAAALACRTAGSWLGARGAISRNTFPVLCLAFVLPTVFLAALLVANLDPRIIISNAVLKSCLIVAVIAVPVQWSIIRLANHTWQGSEAEVVNPSRSFSMFGGRSSRIGVALSVMALMIIGFWLRVRDLPTEPMQWDEVENYEATLGIWERGFPSRVIHPDLPIAYMHTSELFFGPTALASLVFQDDRWVVRFPGVCWSTLTILLIFLTGRMLFGTGAGLVAAAIHTFSPSCIAMSDFGRYFSQLQFFTLLSIYFYWRTIRGSGPLNPTALWLTAFSFLAAFLTWEGAALVAPGMILAVLVYRRDRLRTIFRNGAVWLALLIVGCGVLLQFSHVILQQTQFLWYGTSHSDAGLRPMWNYPFYQPWYYIWESSWSQDALIPMLGLVGAVILAIHHPYRHPVRFLLLIHVTTCLIMAMLLEASAFRYIHHMIPMTILLASATLMAVFRAMIRISRHAVLPRTATTYAYATGGVVVLTILILGSGLTLQLPTVAAFRVEEYGLRTYKFPNLQGPADFLRRHLQPGDLVLATDPFQINHMVRRSGMTDFRVDYWPESILRHPATLEDNRSLPVDRRDATPMLPDLESLQEVFRRHDRIWYVVQPERHWDQTLPEVNDFFYQHMQVAYEDAGALVLLRDKHRLASRRRKDEAALRQAQVELLR